MSWRAKIVGRLLWFNQFDENGDGRLQRDELRALLTWLHPSRPPTEQNLDFLITKATAIESSSLTIPGNKDGDVSWHDVRPCVLDYGDYCKDQSYIDSVFQRFDSDLSGELDAEELLQLLRSIAPEEISVDMTDVEYVLQQFDLNSDGVIDRDELLPMLAKWAHIAFEKVEEQHALQEKGRRQWQMIAAEAKNVGGVIATGGERMLSLVQLARQVGDRVLVAADLLVALCELLLEALGHVLVFPRDGHPSADRCLRVCLCPSGFVDLAQILALLPQ